MTIVQVKNLRKTYPLGKVLVEAVKGINFSIDKWGICFHFRTVRLGKIHYAEYDRIDRYTDLR